MYDRVEHISEMAASMSDEYLLSLYASHRVLKEQYINNLLFEIDALVALGAEVSKRGLPLTK